MSFFAVNWEETSRRLAALLEPHLAGEELLGVVHATQPRTFSADLFAVGVTPGRLLLQPIGRKLEAKGAPVSIAREAVSESSVWGWGGSLADFLSATANQQIRFTAGGEKYKLMVLGGNALEDALSGPSQKHGLEALVKFLLSAKPI
jgi:hypothetical protein